ncbi:hypothetical protein [Streptomyces guryensis]|uniref:Uncharacterized protein n=1 Tax=Streptomyces guryensis TaxID=2886947 RepID=A0A9Q3VU84_9ACTN|nr:hypothetical protein [Streptomyces guryensis]MCD9878709.1 hypothetical protein [Streptomyces guryensis]
MPGQRKRKHREREERRHAAERDALEPGHWKVVFETQDESEWRAQLRRLRATDRRMNWSTARVDTLCGRLRQPTTYRLSVFVAARHSQ